MIPPAMHRPSFRHVAALLLLTPVLLSGRQAVPPAAPAADMVDRIFKSREFSAPPAAPLLWLDGGASYALIEPAGDGRGANLVKYDSATGAKREVAISAAQLTPKGAQPLAVEDLTWSADEQRVLVFTNSRRVWRTNSRGDYWLLDRKTGALKKLGGSAPEASLMYAQFNPDATKVAYVRENDI
jgi:dipeptidyl-peptidase-4